MPHKLIGPHAQYQVFRRKVLSHFSWVFHPISIFVGIQILSVTLISLWVVWFVGRQRDMEQIVARFRGVELPVDTSSGVSVLVTGIVALVMVLVGSVLLFIWGQRQASFIRQQRSFVSSVTHELRTPLASMHLAHETLLSRDLPEATRTRLLNMSLLDINRLTRLVNQILISSRLDRGLAMFQEDIQVIRIAERLKGIVLNMTHLAADAPARISVDCPDDLAFRMSDNAFILILGNLIENAIKYSPAGSPIKIHVQPDGGMIRFSVEDQGAGLDKREKRKIFKMFYRGGQATNKAVPGTGLGLFIVKTSLEQLGGKIDVESEGRGEGSVFHVWLPSL